jgi:hypothetical protein
MVMEGNGNLTIYGVSEEDEGVYKCTIGHSVGGPVFLTIDHTEVVKIVR